MDKLINCNRCGGNACYEQKISDEVKTWLCMGCGFTTSSHMKKDSDLVKRIVEESPELYKDLEFVDSDGLHWYPATITLPQKGMVFIDGTSVDNWRWSAAKAVEIPQEEKDKYPADQTHRMDMDNVLYFGKKDFMEALDHISFFAV